MKAYINNISYYLPKNVLSNELIHEYFPEWDINIISSKTGITFRHISGKNEFTSNMSLQVATKLFEEHNIDKNSIDFLLLCTQSPNYFLPTTSCIFHDKLGL